MIIEQPYGGPKITKGASYPSLSVSCLDSVCSNALGRDRADTFHSRGTSAQTESASQRPSSSRTSLRISVLGAFLLVRSLSIELRMLNLVCGVVIWGLRGADSSRTLLARPTRLPETERRPLPSSPEPSTPRVSRPSLLVRAFRFHLLSSTQSLALLCIVLCLTPVCVVADGFWLNRLQPHGPPTRIPASC